MSGPDPCGGLVPPPKVSRRSQSHRKPLLPLGLITVCHRLVASISCTRPVANTICHRSVANIARARAEPARASTPPSAYSSPSTASSDSPWLLAQRRADALDLAAGLVRSPGRRAQHLFEHSRSSPPCTPACLPRAPFATPSSAPSYALVHRLQLLVRELRQPPVSPASVRPAGESRHRRPRESAVRRCSPGAACSDTRASAASGSQTSQQRPSGAPARRRRNGRGSGVGGTSRRWSCSARSSCRPPSRGRRAALIARGAARGLPCPVRRDQQPA